jgi:D-alanine-D-alanine ligase-like ATP-grasp enzyme
VREPWRAHPLAWIHRAEARAIARELKADVASFGRELPKGKLLLRLSDPVMREVVRALKVPYCGPGSAALERCYDKYEAHRIVTAGGIDAPETFLASEAPDLPGPLVLKPRRGSDSIGVRVLRRIPLRDRNPENLVQSFIVGEEVTVALFRDQVGMPLRIFLPPRAPHSFLRKYFLRPRRAPLDDSSIRRTALKIGRLLGVDWAARVDLMVEAGSGRLCFLECDAAPLVGPGSAFAASFAAAGVDRATQLRWLLD